MIRNMLSLSTGHMPGPNPEFGDFPVFETEYGFLVMVRDPEQFDDLVLTCPDWLRPVMVFANAHKCMLVEFDCDSPRVDELPYTEW